MRAISLSIADNLGFRKSERELAPGFWLLAASLRWPGAESCGFALTSLDPAAFSFPGVYPEMAN